MDVARARELIAIARDWQRLPHSEYFTEFVIHIMSNTKPDMCKYSTRLEHNKLFTNSVQSLDMYLSEICHHINQKSRLSAPSPGPGQVLFR